MLDTPLLLEKAENAAEMLRVLANPQRLLIACLLCEGDFAVSEIEARLGIRQPTLSQQLGVLRGAGAIEGQRAAKAVIYRLADPRMRALLQSMHAIFCPEARLAADEPLPLIMAAGEPAAVRESLTAHSAASAQAASGQTASAQAGAAPNPPNVSTMSAAEHELAVLRPAQAGAAFFARIENR